MRKALSLVALFIVTACVTFTTSSAQQAISVHDPGFRHPVARNAHRAYQQQMQQAWAEYQAKVAEAQTAYLSELDRAAEMSQRGGYEEEEAKINFAREAIRLADAPSAGFPDLADTEWAMIQRGGRYWRVRLNTDGTARVAGGNPARRSWMTTNSVLQLGDDTFVWNGLVFQGVGEATHRSLVPWPWES